MAVDPELDARLNLELPADDIEGGPDAWDNFEQNRKLAGAIGWADAESVARATQNIKTAQRRPTAETAPAPSRDAQPLEKRDEMVSFYENWLSGQMATLGKSSAEVVEAWRADFPDAQPDIVAALEQAQRIVDGV